MWRRVGAGVGVEGKERVVGGMYRRGGKSGRGFTEPTVMAA